MSWKLTQKLKGTHLGVGNPFARSPSTSTIPTTETPSSRSSTPVAKQNDPNGIATSSEVNNAPGPPPLKPGTLRITLHEGRGFSLPAEAERLFASAANAGGASMGTSMRQPPSSLAQGGGAASYYNNNNSGRPKPPGAGPGAGPGINAVPTNHGRYSAKHLPYALVDFDKQQVFVNAVSGNPENPLWAGDNTGYQFDVSRAADVTISFYVRNPAAPPSAGRNHDILVGTCKINPRFEEQPRPAVDPKRKNGPAPDRSAAANATAGWVNLIFGTGMFKLGVEFVETRQRSLAIDDFELLKVVGKGSFGKVMQVRKKDTHRIYALKSIRKAHIISRSEVSHTMAERSVLAQINNPFIVPLKFSFQSPDKLYLVLAFVNGGELFHHLQKEQRFDINRARFYAAELLCALECLHGFNVIYRDLKPENILLDYTGHIALCDFGLCKLDMRDETKTNTFCGTPEYLAPELLQGTGYNKSVDWWTLGVLLYEMLTGLPPFYDENTNEMYRKILNEPLHFPSDKRVMPDTARDLLEKLLDRNGDRRLGANGAAEIKAHRFFDKIDWRKLLERKYDPVFKPNVMDQLDTANFDREFTSEAPTDSYVEGPMLSSTMQQQFAGWSYNRPVAGLGDAGGSVKDPSFGSVT